LTLAVVFPGQGAKELLEVAERLYEDGGPPRALLDRAAREAGLASGQEALSKAGRALERTAVAQPILGAVCLALFARLQEHPVCALGHSLGEVIAWCVASRVPDADTLRLVGTRGRAMDDACVARPGKLLAVSPDSGWEKRLAGLDVTVAVHNGPGEIVLGGDERAIRAAQRELGGTVLRAAGAFHTDLMGSAVEPFAKALFEVQPLEDKRMPVIWSQEEETPAPRTLDEEHAWLVRQLTRPIDFGAAILRAAQLADEFLVIGPASAVVGTLRRVVPAARVRVLDGTR